LVLACFFKTLAENSSNERFAVVQTHAHRRRFHPQVKQIVGPFTSTSICLADQVRGVTLQELAGTLNAQVAEDLLHRDICATGVLGAIARESGHLPNLPVVFTARLGTTSETASRSWLDCVSYAISQTPGVALECRVQERKGRLDIAWDI